ncbi:hypothetical protein K6T82_01275 [Flavobacterium sp. 17A]|uniref:DUF2938 domain-containing protein n=1 Tax=Flavobacterium potami TaxID=2872310 RepID=A0A9X1H6F3_9FLAO|nr:hypothetical protein [Flavobacterium potami]MBZ4033380.1 hypothetical protein [Flavobacterium potami]
MDPYLIVQLILISIGATSAMTWFSYFISKIFQKQYKEPIILATVFGEFNFNISGGIKRKVGWMLHFLIGFLFVAGYHIILDENILSISIPSAILLGSISGIIGIIGWFIIFKNTNYKPRIDFTGYYIQLFFAHIVFALVAVFLYYMTLILVIVTKDYITYS